MLTIDTIPHIQYQIENSEITIRPMTSADAEKEAEFIRNLSLDAKHNRFLGGINELSAPMLKKLCDIDGKNVMAFVATINVKDQEKLIGVSRYAVDDNPIESEVAVTVGDDWQHHGIGRLLLESLIKYAKNNGIELLYSIDLISNAGMHHLAKELGMSASTEAGDAKLVRYSLNI
jgi:acetyltransferase